jgi:hypothetical protein
MTGRDYEAQLQAHCSYAYTAGLHGRPLQRLQHLHTLQRMDTVHALCVQDDLRALRQAPLVVASASMLCNKALLCQWQFSSSTMHLQ